MNNIKDHKCELDGIINGLRAELKSTSKTTKEFQDHFEEKIIKDLNGIKAIKQREVTENGAEQRHGPESSDCHLKRLDASEKRNEKTPRSWQTSHGDGPGGSWKQRTNSQPSCPGTETKIEP